MARNYKRKPRFDLLHGAYGWHRVWVKFIHDNSFVSHSLTHSFILLIQLRVIFRNKQSLYTITMTMAAMTLA